MRLQKTSFRTLLVMTCFLSLSTIPAANAGHNWNIAQMDKESLDASILVYTAFSVVYQCVVLLEKNRVNDANSQWEEKVLSNLRNARSIYEKSVPKLPNKYMDLVAGIPRESQPIILEDLGRYGIPLPVSIRDLANVSAMELRKLEDSFAQVKFGTDIVKNQALLRTINERMTRFISLGISFSTISMWNAK